MNTTVITVDKMTSSPNSNREPKLQEATQYCAKGRQVWANGDFTQALSEFRHALLILETILGCQHVLVAQLYQWIGLIYQEQLQYPRAEESFVKYLRIQFAMQQKGIGSPQQDANISEAQVTLTNLWQAQGLSSSRSFDMIKKLQESVRLELEGDAMLLTSSQAPNYVNAMKFYQQAMSVFSDEHHHSIMSKMAKCYHKAKGSGNTSSAALNSISKHNHTNYFLDQAVTWYRMAMKVLCTSCRFPEEDPSSIHRQHNSMTSHPDYRNMQQQLEAVLLDYCAFEFTNIRRYVTDGQLLQSIFHQHIAEKLLSSTRSRNEVSTKAKIEDIAKARNECQAALKIEQTFYQSSKNAGGGSPPHLVVLNLQKELASIDEQCVLRLEEERSVSEERLQLLEQQSADWVSTVRHQEDQLHELQSSLRSRAGHAGPSLNVEESKEADEVGWKRKFEVVQGEWKAAQQKIQTAEGEKAGLVQLLKQTENKLGSVEYSLKKQCLDYEALKETLRKRTKEVEDWKEKYQVADQGQQLLQRRLERSEANERELDAQVQNLQSQIVVLKDWTKELRAEQQLPLISSSNANNNNSVVAAEYENQLQHIQQLQSQLEEANTTKIRAIKKLKKYHQQRQQQQGGAEEASKVIILLEEKVQILEKDRARLEKALQERKGARGDDDRKQKPKKRASYVFSAEDSDERIRNLTARLDKSNDALATLHADHRAKQAELDSLLLSKNELEKEIADAQGIIATLKKANDERVEKLEEIKAENDKLKQLYHADGSLSRSLDLKDIASIVDVPTPNALDSETTNMLIDQVADLHLQNEDLQERLEKTTDDNRKLAMAVRSMKEALQESKDETAVSRSHSRSISTSAGGGNGVLEARLNQAEAANEEMAAMVRVMSVQIQDLTSPSRDDTTSGRSSVCVTVLEEELKEAKHQIDELKAHSQALQTAADLSRKFMEDNEASTNRVCELEAELEKVLARENKLAEKLSVSKDKLKLARKEVEERDILFGRISDLEKDLKDANGQKHQLVTEKESFKNQLESILGEVEEKRNLSAKYNQLQETLAESQKETAGLRAEIEAVQTALRVGNEDEVQRLTSEVDQLHQRLKESQRRNDQLKSATHIAREENIRMHDQLTTLEEELGDEKNRHSELLTRTNLERQSLYERLNELEEQMRDLRDQNDELGTDVVERSSKDLLHLQERNLNLEKRLHEALDQSQKVSQAEQHSKGLAEMLAKESREQQRLVNKCAKLEKDLQESGEQNERFAAQVDILSNQVTELQKRLDSIEMEHIEEHDELLKRCQELEEKRHETLQDGEVSNGSSQPEESCSKIQELMEKNKELEGQMESRKGNSELIERCATLEQELIQTVDRNEELSNQVDSLGEKVQELDVYARETFKKLEDAEALIQTLKASEAPSDDDFARLLDRCTDLEAEKSLIEYEMKQHRDSAIVLEKIKKERDELQQQLDAALEDFVRLQHGAEEASAGGQPMQDEDLVDRLEALADAKDELKRLLDEALQENVELHEGRRRMSERVKKAEYDRDEVDALYQQSKREIAEVKSQMIACEELLKEAKVESDEMARLLEIEKQVSSSLKAATQAGPDEESELEELYRQAREEMKELEEMLLEAEEQIEHLKSKCEKLEQQTKLSSHELIEAELSNETVHSLNGLSRDELIKENRKTLHKLQEARMRTVDQQENITILQAQLRDALKFHELKRVPPKKTSTGGSGFGAFWGRGKKDQPVNAEKQELE